MTHARARNRAQVKLHEQYVARGGDKYLSELRASVAQLRQQLNAK
jgi:hypothetical protein